MFVPQLVLVQKENFIATPPSRPDFTVPPRIDSLGFPPPTLPGKKATAEVRKNSSLAYPKTAL